MTQRVRVVAGHPDDYVLGCGGTIARLTDSGNEVHTLFLADGVSARHPDGVVDPDEFAARREAARRACDILGVSTVEFHDLPDNRMDTVALLEVVRIVENYVQAFHPEVVLTHDADELNIDHQRTHQAVVTASRPQPNSSVQSLRYFAVASSTDWRTPTRDGGFAPSWFVDITPTLDRKLDVLGCYDTEMRDWPHARSLRAIDALARMRGASVGVEAAEAFVLGRHRDLASDPAG